MGPEGKAGATGPEGKTGATGAKGETGAAGARVRWDRPGRRAPPEQPALEGPAGEVELVICNAVSAHGKTVQDCRVKEGASPFKFTGSGRKIAAELRHDKTVYAKGFELDALKGSEIELVLRPKHKLSSGRYTLVIKHKHRLTRETITLQPV